VDFQLSEDVFDFGEQTLTLGLVLDAGERSHFLHQLALPFIQFGRGLHAYLDDQVALAVSAKNGDALPFHAQRGPGLRTLRDFKHVVAVERGNFDFCAERCLRERDRNHTVEVLPFALEKGVLFHVEHDVEIAGGAAVLTRLAESGVADLRAVFDAFWDRDR
jgi:hypothetical protein